MCGLRVGVCKVETRRGDGIDPEPEAFDAIRNRRFERALNVGTFGDQIRRGVPCRRLFPRIGDGRPDHAGRVFEA